MGLYKFHHLGNCFSWQNWKQVSNQKELEVFFAYFISWLKFTKCDSLTIVSAASSSIDKWRVESMDIVVFIVDEKAFTHSCITVVVCLYEEPKVCQSNLILLNFIRKYRALVGNNHLFIVSEYCGEIPVFFFLQILEKRGIFNHY